MKNAPSPKQQLNAIYQLIRQNKPQEARRLLQQFFKENPPDADAFYISTFLTTDLERKILMCEKALEINPNHGPVMQLLGKLYAEQDERAAAPEQPESFADLPSSVSQIMSTSSTSLPKSAPMPASEKPEFRDDAPAAKPFEDAWGAEQIKAFADNQSAAASAPPAKVPSSAKQPQSSASMVLMFGAGLLIGLIVAGIIGALAVSQTASQPTLAPVILVVTATDVPVIPTRRPLLPTDTETPPPPTRTRLPTFTAIPTRTPASGSTFKTTPNGTELSDARTPIAPSSKATTTTAINCARTLVGGAEPNLPTMTIADLYRCRPDAEKVVAAIRRNGPFAYDRDNITFQNREGFLPDAADGSYREYTVDTPGASTRGTRRLITSGARNRQPSSYTALYYTDDHYETMWLIRE